MAAVKNDYKLVVSYRSPSTLKADPKNPRTHTDKQVRQIAHSVEAFGFNVPVLVDSDSNVIAGHGRVHAAHFLKLKKVPTIRLDHLSAEQRRAFMIADNRLCENATWDDRLLGEQLKFLSLAEINFNLETTGFEMAEIDLFIDGLSTVPEDEVDPTDDLPELANAKAVSLLGDLWCLDRHRLLCGDALQASNYPLLMRWKKAHLVLTDPPFNSVIDGNVSGFGKRHHREFVMAAGEMSDAEFSKFLHKARSEMQPSTVSTRCNSFLFAWIGEILAFYWEWAKRFALRTQKHLRVGEGVGRPGITLPALSTAS